MDETTENQPRDNEALWKQYALYVDLFKLYINSALKVSIAYYAVTAAVIAFEFALPARKDSAHLALLLPALFGLVLSVIFWLGSFKAQELQANVDELGRRLDLVGTAHISILILFLRAAAFMYLLVSGVLLTNIWRALGGWSL